jgi:hypothetical protein
VLVETAPNALKTSIIFFNYLAMIKVYLIFLQKVGVFGKERTVDLFTITAKEFIK